MEKKQSLYSALLGGAIDGNRTALLYKGRKISYSALLSRVDTMAYVLKSLGVEERDVVSVCLPNIPEAVYMLYAINKLGAIAHYLHPLLSKANVIKHVEKVKGKILIIPKYRAGEFKKEEIKILTACPSSELGAIKKAVYLAKERGEKDNFLNLGNLVKIKENVVAGKRLKEVETRYDTPSVYLQSGGTSGEPKTVMLSAFAINSLAACGLNLLCESSAQGKYMLSVLPMFHAFGMVMNIHTMLCMGGTDVLIPKFSVRECLSYISKNQAHYILGVPLMFDKLVKSEGFRGAKLRNIKVAFVGGDFISSGTIEMFDSKVKNAGGMSRLNQGYGITEACSVVSTNTNRVRKAGSCGKPVGCVSVAVIENGKKMPSGVEGELGVSGSSVMNGYFENMEDNDPKININGSAYLLTGDYGLVDKDGFVFIKQRIRRIIKVNGVNVFPVEAERILEREFGIATALIGVKNEEHGFVPRLIIEREERLGKNTTQYEQERLGKGNTATQYEQENALKQEVSNLLETSLSIYYRPDSVIFVDKLPRTALNKIDFLELETKFST